MLSVEYNIVVCTSFKEKINFCEFSLFTVLEISHARKGGLGFNLNFWEVQTKPFRNIGYFLFTPNFGRRISRT